MKTLDAGQASLLASPQLSVVTLCKLTTYSDRAAGTVQATRYFSDGARLYDWANLGTVRQFEPWLLTMEPARDTMNHLPSLDGGGIESALRRRRTITLRNWLPETASYLYATLRAENLEHARIEIAQLFVDRGAGASFNDLSALTGAEQTWLFRGEVASVVSVSEQEIHLELVAELPQIPWIYADDAGSNDLRDLGARLPIVYGSAKRVRCIGWVVGGSTTLSSRISGADTSIELTDASAFGSSGAVLIGREQVTYTGKSGQTLTGCVRGSNGTDAVLHEPAEPVLELGVAGVRYVVAGHPVRAISNVYVKAGSGDLTRLTTGFSGSVSDAVTIPGRTVASIALDSGQLAALISSFAATPKVTQQPRVSTQPVSLAGATGGTPTTDAIPVSPTHANLRDSDPETSVALDNQGGTDSVTITFGTVASITTQTIRIDAGSAYGAYYRVTTGSGIVLGTFGGGGIKSFSTTYTGHSYTITLVRSLIGEGDSIGSLVEVTRDYVVSGTTANPRLDTETAIAEDPGSQVEISGFSGGAGLQIYADVEGYQTPVPVSAGYAFDEGTGWSVLAGTHTSDTVTKAEGSAAQKFEPTATLRYSMDSDAANWTKSQAYALENESVITSDGGGSVKGTSSSVGNAAEMRRSFADEDFTGFAVRFDVYLPDNFSFDTTDGFRFTIGSNLGNPGTDRRRWNFGTSDLVFGAWNTIQVDPSTGWDTTTGTFVITAANWLVFTWNVNVGGGSIDGNVIYIDNIHKVPVGGSRMQLNATAATVDLTADSSEYTLAVRADDLEDTDQVVVYFSNTAGSGTTKPTNRWELTIDAAELATGVFVDVTKIATVVGSPGSPTNIETFGVEIVGAGGSAVWVDNLRRRDNSLPTDYLAGHDALLTEMPDILRHLLAEVCGLGQSAIDTSFATLGGATYLDDNAHGIELGQLGSELRDVLAGLAYESRANLVADERSSGTVYRLLAALSTYAWPAASVTLAKWQELIEEGRLADAIATRFRHLYQWRPELGSGIESFTAAIQTTVTAAETKFGRHDADPVGLRSVEATATASEIAGYYEQELSRVAAIWSMKGVPWIDGFALERGDVVAFTPPWRTATKARVVETTLRTDGLTDLRLVEVS